VTERSREMSAPRISVIVAFRDVRPYLSGCIASLLDQTLPRDAYEVIFVDNGSIDGGDAEVAELPGVRLLREQRLGVYVARNAGLRAARGEVFAFTDPDCVVERDWLERIASAVRSPGVGIVLGQRVAESDEGLLSLVMAYESCKAAFVTSRGLEEAVFGHTNNMAVTRTLMDAIGPFPEVTRGGDTVLVRRAVDARGCGVVRYLPDLRVRHREIATLRDYYGKARTYGRSNECLRALVSFRPLTVAERWRVFRDTAGAQAWSPARAALALAALVPGWLCYEWGRHASRSVR
jgi:glycosyltransferase involved in cell wall biosynthesis